MTVGKLGSSGDVSTVQMIVVSFSEIGTVGQDDILVKRFLKNFMNGMVSVGGWVGSGWSRD